MVKLRKFLFGFAIPIMALLILLSYVLVFAAWISLIGLIIWGIYASPILTLSLVFFVICMSWGFKEVNG